MKLAKGKLSLNFLKKNFSIILNKNYLFKYIVISLPHFYFLIKSNYERFKYNNFKIYYWSWNYRGCWHQTFPPIVALVLV